MNKKHPCQNLYDAYTVDVQQRTEEFVKQLIAHNDSQPQVSAMLVNALGGTVASIFNNYFTEDSREDFIMALTTRLRTVADALEGKNPHIPVNIIKEHDTLQ